MRCFKDWGDPEWKATPPQCSPDHLMVRIAVVSNSHSLFSAEKQLVIVGGCSQAEDTFGQNSSQSWWVKATVSFMKERAAFSDSDLHESASAYLFGLLYAINIGYPKQMGSTFEAIQAIFFELGGSGSSQCKRSLKTKLLLWLWMGKPVMTLTCIL